MRKVIAGAQGKTGAPYSGAVIANGLVFLSGQTFEGPDIETQTKGVLDKIAALLRDAGTDLEHAVRCTVYLADITLRDRMNAVYKTYFPSEPPARATVGCVLALPSLLVEIDCVAVLPS